MLKITQTRLYFISLWLISLCSLWSQAPSINADFQVSPTGALTYSIPIGVPPHTLSIFPNLSLAYSSQSGDGVAGYGWNLTGLSSITRIAATPYYDDLNDPVDFDQYDRFTIDGQRLILNSGTYGNAGSSYTTESYSNVKIEAINTSSFGTNYGPAGFIVTQPDGTRYYYGLYNNSRSKLEWSLCRIIDTQGNQVNFSYTIQDETLRLDNINDSEANISAAFTYGTKTNTLPIGIGGQLFRNNRLLTAVNVTVNEVNYNAYELEHSTTSANFSRLNKIEQTSLEDGHLPDITFSYPSADNNFEEYSGSFDSQIGNSSVSITRSGDLNGDEISDYLFYNSDRDDADYKGITIKEGNTSGSFGFVDSIFTTTEFEEAFFVKYADYLGRVQEDDGIVVISRSGSSNKFYFNLYAKGSYGMSFIRSIEWLAPIKNSNGEIVTSTSYIASANVPELSYQVADFNSDGVTDIVPITLKGGTYTRRVCYEDCSGEGPIVHPQSQPLGPVNELNSASTNLIFPTNCVTVCENYSDYNWSQFYLISMEPSYNTENNINTPIGAGTYTDVNYSIADINADGYPDIYYKERTSLCVDAYDPITKKFVYSPNVYLETDTPVYPGDYNGDGKTDFVQPKANNSSSWYFYINKGTGFEIDEQTIGIVYEENKIDSHVYTDKVFASTSIHQYLYLPIDYNKDGKTDMIKHRIVAPADSYTSTYSYQKIDFYENTSKYVTSSNYINFTSDNSTTKNNIGKPREGHPMSADVNHINLRNQYAYADYDGTITIYSYSGDHNKEVRLEKITNNGLTTTVNYNCLGESAIKLGASATDYEVAFPYNTVASAKDFKLVSSVHQAISGLSRAKLSLW